MKNLTLLRELMQNHKTNNQRLPNALDAQNILEKIERQSFISPSSGTDPIFLKAHTFRPSGNYGGGVTTTSFTDSKYLDESMGDVSDVKRHLAENFLKSLKKGGFSFIIDYEELRFDAKGDLIGSGGYGDVFKGVWLGVVVAVKKFGKRYVNRKAIKEV